MSKEQNPLPAPKNREIRLAEKPATLELFEKGSLDQEGVEALTRDLTKIINTPDRYIDEGGAAKVYRLSDKICVKMMHDRTQSPAVHLMKLGNTATVEAGFLRKASGESVDGVCTPWCYGVFSIRGAKPLTGIIMEELDAVNLEHALQGKQPFPKKFQTEAFLNSIAAYLDFLHEEMGFSHGDLFARNIMVDRETGAARIIDFGRSTDFSSLPAHKKTALIEQDLKNFDVIEERLTALSLDKS